MRKIGWLLAIGLLVLGPTTALASGVLGVGGGSGPGPGNQVFVNAGKISRSGGLNGGLEVHFGSGTGQLAEFFLAPQVSLGVGSASGTWRAYALGKRYLVGGVQARTGRLGLGLAVDLPGAGPGVEVALERTGDEHLDREAARGAWLAQVRLHP
ncbi:hypothetical protein [Thiohalorhabdus methylotrophus]|uniref:Uncharacterized protein n=1 Tax=Thiohalorhabdus methylotrophus TaxID=3242694 RepID=A0ABV4TYK4_9GAMM